MGEYKKLQKENSDEVSVDIPQWGSKKTNEYKDIVLDTIKKIEECSNKQFRSGGVVWAKEGEQWIKVELEDTIKIYSQLVDFFEDIMLRYFDEEMEKNLKKIKIDVQEKHKKLLADYIAYEPKKQLKDYAISTGSFPPQNPVAKKFDERFNGYKHYSCRQRFRALLLLFARKRDLVGKRTASVY